MLQREADVIEAVQQAMATEGLDFELCREATAVGERAGFEVGRQLIRLMLASALEQLFDLLLGKADREQAVLEAVVVKDIGKAGGDNRAESIVFERPGGVFSARTTAEVAAGEQDAGAFGVRLVQLEVGIERAVVIANPVPEQELSEAGSLDPLEELLGDDLIGVDVGAVEGDDFAGVGGEGFHCFSLEEDLTTDLIEDTED